MSVMLSSSVVYQYTMKALYRKTADFSNNDLLFFKARSVLPSTERITAPFLSEHALSPLWSHRISSYARPSAYAVRTEDSEGLPIEVVAISRDRLASSQVSPNCFRLVSLQVHQLTSPLEVATHKLHLGAHGWNSIRTIWF